MLAVGTATWKVSCPKVLASTDKHLEAAKATFPSCPDLGPRHSPQFKQGVDQAGSPVGGMPCPLLNLPPSLVDAMDDRPGPFPHPLLLIYECQSAVQLGRNSGNIRSSKFLLFESEVSPNQRPASEQASQPEASFTPRIAQEKREKHGFQKVVPKG